ncbi:MAG TPA: HlyD family type I secretion periplasmic adaptor subunit, partial [Micavibrio sp.]|nr:HlyD family type I secretion periplasmic adaptor subunit [Micavibrio sp.]
MRRTSENQIRHLSQAVQLEEAVSPTIIRTTMMTIGVTIIAFTIWAGFTNINEVARAPGEIVPSGYQQVVQHLEGGLVRKIDVAEGDMVEKGQELVLLDGAGFAEDLELARGKQLALSLQEERLRAYLERRDPDFSQFKVSDEAALRDQQNFFKSMEVSNAEERKIVQEQIVQKRRVIGSLQSELKTAEGNREISQKLFNSRRELYGKGFLSETKFLEAQQALNSINGEISQIKSRLSVSQAEISEYQNRLNSLGLTQNDEINMRLDSILVEKAQNEEVLRKLEERFARLSIRAPVSGIVKGLAVNTIGAIVRPGETLMEIVPVDHEMVVQVKIEPQHVGHIKIGQPVKVKLSSF